MLDSVAVLDNLHISMVKNITKYNKLGKYQGISAIETKFYTPEMSSEQFIYFGVNHKHIEGSKINTQIIEDSKISIKIFQQTCCCS